MNTPSYPLRGWELRLQLGTSGSWYLNAGVLQRLLNIDRSLGFCSDFSEMALVALF